ncbi:hypothetical protein C8F01DRAFT_1207243 [Mycena amicta]|nr:hypothetical protein C8F01DRAFT_1207243 [Mycena amicta]
MAQYLVSPQAYFKEPGGIVSVVDAIPLLHHWTSLSPMMEIGLDLAGRHADSAGLNLVGYYQACERIDDVSLAPVGERVAGKLKEGFKNAVAFVVDGEKLGSGEAALIPYLPQGITWRPESGEQGFSAGSKFQFTSKDAAQRALALVRDEWRHETFGDFDDHLEDVTIARHTSEDKTNRQAVTDDKGEITRFEPAESQAELSSCFVVPSFVDTHLHAPQFLYQGNGLHLPLMQWLNEYAFKAEERLDGDPELARKVYTRLARRLIQHGTGTVLFFGTIKEETNLILADVMKTAGLRAFVGKLSMDALSKPSYIESSAQASLQAAQSFAEKCRAMNSTLHPHEHLIEPVLTPRFSLSTQQNIRIQSHLAEALDQVEFVRSQRGAEDIDVFDRSGLLTPRTIQAHCTFLDIPSFNRLQECGTAIAHCPLSNSYFSAEPFHLREALDAGVKVGLGTDIAGGYSLDIMNSMRHAVSVSRMRQGTKQIKAAESGDAETNSSLAINWMEALYLATKGGADALGLRTGAFVIGAPFDAQQILLFDSEGNGVGALDFFDLEGADILQAVTLEMIEKWWCLGEKSNRVSMWVQGAKLQLE